MTSPQTIGKYEIIKELGRGGFGVVYQARDTRLNRLVALKMLHPLLSGDPSFVSRFEQEARAIAVLDHPGIVKIYDVDEAESHPYLAMAYLSGPTLREMIKTGGPTLLDQAIPLLHQLAAALDYAHGRGVIHRDLKPGNIIIHDSSQGPQAVLLDFGLAKALAITSALTSSGVLLGSPEYMAPEQTDPNRAAEVGPAADRYALGIVAYELLTGRVPFPGNTPSTLYAHEHKAPPSPLTLRPDLPEPAAAALLKMLAKAPTQRYPTASGFVVDLIGAYQASQRSAQLTALYEQLRMAREGQDWAEVLGLGEQIVALDPDYRNVSQEITDARRRLQPPSQPAPPPPVAEPPLQSQPPAPVQVPAKVEPQQDATQWQATQTVTQASRSSQPVPTSAGPPKRQWLWGLGIGLLGLVGLAGMSGLLSNTSTSANPTATFRVAILAESTDTPKTVASEQPKASPSPPDLQTSTSVPTIFYTSTGLPTNLTATLTPQPLQPNPSSTVAPVLIEPVSFSLSAQQFNTKDPIEFIWEWPGTLTEDLSFEIRLLLPGSQPISIQDAQLLKQAPTFRTLTSSRYSVSLILDEAGGVPITSSDYFWSVGLVQIEPDYKWLGIESAPRRISILVPKD